MKKSQRATIKKLSMTLFAAPVLLASIFSLPANAALLHGYVSQTNASEQQDRIISTRIEERQQPVARTDSFPTEVQGSWQCVTVVVDSLVDSVPVGQKIVSRMDFVKTNDGRVVARFLQPGWTEAQETVTALSANRYQMDKTNYYHSSSWAARSRDRYQVLERNRMIAESEVDQYVDGCYMGRYRTRSTLVRFSNGTENVAAAPMPDPDDHSGDGNPFMNK